MQEYEERTMAKKKGGWNWIRYVVYFAFGLIGAWLLYRAFNIFNAAFLKWDLMKIAQSCATIGGAPIVGGFLGGVCGFVARFVIALAALSAMLGLYLLQAMPLLMWYLPEHFGHLKKKFKLVVTASVIAFLVELVIVWSVRGWHTDIVTVLIDSLAFDLLLFGLFNIREMFSGSTNRQAQEVE